MATPRLSDMQRQRLVFGVICTPIGGLLLNAALWAAPVTRSGSQLVPAAIGVLLLGIGVYLLIRFFQHRRNEKNTPPLPK